MKRIAILTVIGTLALSLSAAAQGPFQNPQIAEKLNLTAEQQQQLEDIHYTHQQKQVSLRHEIQMKRLEQRHEMDGDAPNIQALDALCEEIGMLQVQLAKNRNRFALEVKSILTLEQWNTVKGHFLRMGDGRMGPGARRGMRGGGPQGRGMRGGPGGPGFPPPEDGSDTPYPDF